jgi:hypothetical protein
VSIDEATGFEMDDTVRPVRIGSEVYFVSLAGSYSRVREYFVNDQSLALDAADVTAHVPRYVPDSIIGMAGSDVENCLFLVSDKTGHTRRLYLYQVFWSGDEKVQSAWSYWELSSDDTLLSVDVIEDQVYILVKRADATYLEKCDLDVNAVTGSLSFDILLDRRYEVQPGDMVYSAGLDQTTISLPWEINGQENAVRVVLTSGSGDVGRLMDTTNYSFVVDGGDFDVTVPGDVTGSAPVVGLSYDAEYTLSEQFVYDGNQMADTTGRLNLRTLTVNFKDTAYFEVEVYPYGSGYTGQVEEVVTGGLDAFTGRTLGEASLTTGEPSFGTGTYQAYIDGNSRDVVVKLKNSSYLQSKFTSAEWEGKFTKRTRSI